MLRFANVDVWFQDEARFVNKIRLPDSQAWQSPPELFSNNNSSTSISFGAVCPATGTTEALLSPLVNREVMKQFGTDCSTNKAGRHAVVIMDGAGWHTMECADDFNLSLIKLLPILPELNPIEQVWSWLLSACVG